MRLFLAIDLPTASKKKLAEQLEKLMNDYTNFTWVPPENYHITLYFFGEISNVEKIKKKVEEAIFDVESFRLYSIGADLFIKNKILLYIYFKREKKAEALESKIKNIFQIKDKKKFIPHLTIGRYKVPSKQQYINLKKKLNQLTITIDFPVNNVYLFQSNLSQGKSIYKKIATFRLLKRLRS